MFTLLSIVLILAYLLVVSEAIADRWHDEPLVITLQETPVINNYITEVTEITEYSQLENYGYTADNCQGIAISQAGANNQLYLGSSAVQASIGIGECGGEFASSLMMGMQINTNMMINGSFAKDEDVNAYGVGLWVQFK